MERKLYEASMSGDVTTLMELLEEDPVLLNRVTTSFEFENPLGIAAMCGHVEFAVRILRRKPELATQADQKGLRPLHLAAQGYNVSMVKVLIEENPDVCSLTDQNGRTPLHLAAMRDGTEIMKILIQKQPKAIQMLSEYRSETILHLCVKHNCLDALKLLVDELRKQHINKESIYLISEDNKESISVNSKDGDGNTILHLAVARRNIMMIKYLLNSDTGVEQNAINNKGFTAMDVLIKSDQRELKDMETQDILREAGVLQSDFIQQLVGSHHDDQKPHGRPKYEISETIQKYKFDAKYDAWLKENKNTLMVVSSLIATMAFQGALNPPGGVWQETKELPTVRPFSLTYPSPSPPPRPPNDASDIVYAGSAVMSHEHVYAYLAYMIFISLGFCASMSVILLLLSGFRFSRKLVGRFFVRLLIAVLWSAVTFMTIAYLHALQAFMPTRGWGLETHDYQNTEVVVSIISEVFAFALLGWIGLLGLIIFVHIIRSTLWLLVHIIPSTLWLRRKLRILKKRDGES
ncbi:hypothetical protein MKW98_013383 [Papaver atlanticum]|uniref:PGG domain-containing protein n=1 Tax=Papaver atlanticum TaxID=357466 RepID=A0AAD4SUX4_9MAGN|nr:hypothetical protein MKW98_013383 [Papaver atlanticum]